MKLNTRELKQKLSKLQEIISKKDDGQVDGILCKDGKLIAFNDDVTVTTTIETEKAETLVIPNKSISLINTISDETIELSTNKNKLNIKFGGSKLNHQTYEVDGFPEITEIKHENEILLDAVDFISALQSCIYATSKDLNNAILNGIMINGNGGTIDFVALDGYRVATQSINNKTEFKIIIPNKTISFLLKLNLTEEKVKIKCNDKQIQIETVEYTIISRLIQGEFIDYKKAIPEEFNQVEIEKKKILEIMGRALLLQDGKVKQVTKLIFEKDKMTILHETESSQYQDEIKIKSNIEMTIGVNPKYLFECFKNLNQEIVLVKISEELKPIIVETQNQLSIVLPVRIKAGQ